MEFHVQLTEAEKMDLLAQAAAVCHVPWWPLWCKTKYGEGPLPPHYGHVASHCGWPVEDQQ